MYHWPTRKQKGLTVYLQDPRQPVALHHSGDPNFDPAHKPDYNEGIPFTAILALLEKRGLIEELGK